jgi:molybdate transport repressor ModE-like protein
LLFLICFIIYSEKNLNAYRYQHIIRRGIIDKITYNYKVWLECNKKPVLGKGRYLLLKNIGLTKSLKLSAEKMGISYKTAQNYIRKIETNLGIKIVDSQKGGSGAGGNTMLNKNGYELMKKYEQMDFALTSTFKEIIRQKLK